MFLANDTNCCIFIDILFYIFLGLLEKVAELVEIFQSSNLKKVIGVATSGNQAQLYNILSHALHYKTIYLKHKL